MLIGVVAMTIVYVLSSLGTYRLLTLGAFGRQGVNGIAEVDFLTGLLGWGSPFLMIGLWPETRDRMRDAAATIHQRIDPVRLAVFLTAPPAGLSPPGWWPGAARRPPAAARPGTLLLIARAIRQVLVEAEEASLSAPPLRRMDDRGRRKPAMAWASETARHALLQDPIADPATLTAWAGAPSHPESLRQVGALLETVAAQDITRGPDGTATSRAVGAGPHPLGRGLRHATRAEVLQSEV